MPQVKTLFKSPQYSKPPGFRMCPLLRIQTLCRCCLIDEGEWPCVWDERCRTREREREWREALSFHSAHSQTDLTHRGHTAILGHLSLGFNSSLTHTHTHTHSSLLLSSQLSGATEMLIDGWNSSVTLNKESVIRSTLAVKSLDMRYWICSVWSYKPFSLKAMLEVNLEIVCLWISKLHLYLKTSMSRVSGARNQDEETKILYFFINMRESNGGWMVHGFKAAWAPTAHL